MNVLCKLQRVAGYSAASGTRIGGPPGIFLIRHRLMLLHQATPLPCGAKMVTCCGLIRWLYNAQELRQRHQSRPTVPFYVMVQASLRVSCKNKRQPTSSTALLTSHRMMLEPVCSCSAF